MSQEYAKRKHQRAGVTISSLFYKSNHPGPRTQTRQSLQTGIIYLDRAFRLLSSFPDVIKQNKNFAYKLHLATSLNCSGEALSIQHVGASEGSLDDITSSLSERGVLISLTNTTSFAEFLTKTSNLQIFFVREITETVCITNFVQI